MKRCTKCNTAYDADGFFRHPRAKDGLQSQCKKCFCAHQNARYRNDPEFREQKKAYASGYSRERRQNPHVRALRSADTAARKYGISVRRVLEMRSQSHCDCCGERLPDKKGWRHIDHCHATGVIRGMVCRTCNLAMCGPIDECIARLRRCVAYLESHRKATGLRRDSESQTHSA